MSEELPDDLRNWPSDPFELLGIDRQADDATIRRAYTRLIRRFKPEHHPEQFQRIREAYEACQQRRFWYRIEHMEPEEAPVAEPVEIRVRAEPPRERTPIEKHWQTARAGDLAKAYEELRALAAAETIPSELALRLYWLLVIDPNLDFQYTRHYWLNRALVESGLSAECLELYRRELVANPAEALAAPYVDLLNMNLPFDRLMTAAMYRLFMAGRQVRISLIDWDFKYLQNKIDEQCEVRWLMYLSSILDWTIWDSHNPLIERVTDQLDLLRHLELSQSYWFDRIDQTFHLGIQASRLDPRQFKPFLNVLRHLWADPYRITREELRELVNPIVNDSKSRLTYRRIVPDDGRNYLLFMATHLLRQQRAYSPLTHDADVLRAMARRIMGDPWQFEKIESAVREFAIRERIDPIQWIEVCENDTSYPMRVFGSYMKEDPAFQWLVMTGIIYEDG